MFNVRRGALALVALIVLVGMVAAQVDAGTLVAININDHGLTKKIGWSSKGHFIPGNKTSVFTQDDQFIYAYFTATFASANFTWLWYEPGGQLFRNSTYAYTCSVSPCSFTYTFPLAGNEPAALPGNWRMDLEAGGQTLYSEYFTILSVVTEENAWQFNILQSTPPRVHCDLTVTIHPNNQTWEYYVLNLPAANATAYDYASHAPLSIGASNRTSLVVVSLGSPRADGYRFVVDFDVSYGFVFLGTWNDGYFAFTWKESSYGTFGSENPLRPVPSSFMISLPRGAALLDVVGINRLSLNETVRLEGQSPTVYFNATLPPAEKLGWTVIYRDYAFRTYIQSLYPNASVTTLGLNVISAQPVPVLPLTLGNISLWSAVMAVFLLTASELISPIYARTGILINRKRLRLIALVLVAIFLVATAYQIILAQSPVPISR